MVAYKTNGERRNRHRLRGSVEADPGYSAKALETNGVNSDVGAVRAALTAAQTGLVDREAIAEAVVLCAIAREHLLVIGPPGTGKSEAVRRVAEVLGGSYFEYLIGRFTEPNELFGPIDLRRLREGVVEVETAGMLPEADVAFLDEVFQGSTAILNTLLGLLNERVYRRGRTAMPVRLRVCVGASNALPDDPALAAFADRFLGRVFVDSVADARLEELLEVGWAAGDGGAETIAGLDAIDRLAAAARNVALGPMQPTIGEGIRRMRSAGIELSDRRAVRAQRLVTAAAVLDGRTEARPGDLWVLPLVAPGPDDQAAAQDALGPLIEEASNATLIHAAEAFARGRRARAARLIATGRALLDEPAGGEDGRLRIEAALREIDAGFSTTEMPEELALVRARLADALSGDDGGRPSRGDGASGDDGDRPEPA
jgi:MoxR-like ATPase